MFLVGWEGNTRKSHQPPNYAQKDLTMYDQLDSLPPLFMFPQIPYSSLCILRYSSNIISSILIDCPERDCDLAESRIVANHADETSVNIDDINSLIEYNQCPTFDITQHDVSDILDEAGIIHAYDQLSAIDLLTAFNVNRSRFLHCANLY